MPEINASKQDQQTRLPQFFITQAISRSSLFDLQIITLPKQHQMDDELLLEILEDNEWVFDEEEAALSYNEDAAFTQLSRVFLGPVLDAEVEDKKEFLESVYNNCQLPQFNSPLSGITLKQLAVAAAQGGGGAFAVAATHPALSLPIYFLILAGTPIILGASKGIGEALEVGLRDTILKIMGISPKHPPVKSSPKAKRMKRAKKVSRVSRVRRT